MILDPETAPFAEWQDPAVNSPPSDSKLLILTEWGVAILGPWRSNGGFVAWAPLPRIPKHIKERLK